VEFALQPENLIGRHPERSRSSGEVKDLPLAGLTRKPNCTAAPGCIEAQCAYQIRERVARRRFYSEFVKQQMSETER
jgi:hypothetical protein